MFLKVTHLRNFRHFDTPSNSHDFSILSALSAAMLGKKRIVNVESVTTPPETLLHLVHQVVFDNFCSITSLAPTVMSGGCQEGLRFREIRRAYVVWVVCH
ncbi:hypothetical protein CDAR_580171 [Caerostris darwini]|uniref:Uncharacterized protein n=1 Tax=Caerostris darwini TaxID=1538125 RepID=A0AAV4PMJ2_9ARAC|nr:hypothetical protein CDAR_580171 [Caerostris darwini]